MLCFWKRGFGLCKCPIRFDHLWKGIMDYIVAPNAAWLWEQISSALHSSPFRANLIRRIFFLNPEHLTNKEPKVTCEMGLKSTHLI